MEIRALLAAWFSRRVFLGGLSHGEPVGFDEHLPTRDLALAKVLQGPCLLFVCTRSIDRGPIHQRDWVHMVDLIRASEGERLHLVDPPVEKVTCIDFFDHRFAEPERNERLLESVERLIYVQRRRVFLLTSREPVSLLGLGTQDGENGALPAELATRWARLLGRFLTIHVGGEAARPLDPEKKGLLQWCWLEREVADLEPLRRCADAILKRASLARMSKDAVIDLMREMGESYYRAIWAILRRDERMVMAQLAADAVISPKNEEAIRHLLARHLLRRDPELRLMNESLARFIRETVPPEELRSWESAGATSAWQQFRFPILLALAAAVAFLVATQQEVFNTATAFISTAAVGAGALLRLLTLLQRRPASAD